MPRIAFISPFGGVGCTTLAAHLAMLLVRPGRLVLAVDLNAQNTLGLHLGLREPPADGWQTALAQGKWWGGCALENSDGVRLLAHGHYNASVAAVCQKPGWLNAQLAELDLPAGSALVLDTPQLPAPLAVQAAHCADMAVLVLDASVRSLHAHGALREFIAELPASTRHAVLITGVDARSSSRRQALKELSVQWQNDLISCPQHIDDHVQQALAQAVCVHQIAPQAQAAHDMRLLAEWIAQACGLDGDSAGTGLANATGGVQ